MPEELITAGSDRAYFQHYCESIYVDDEERIVFPDELAGYTIVPYAAPSKGASSKENRHPKESGLPPCGSSGYIPFGHRRSTDRPQF